jgi:hypothetical protein
METAEAEVDRLNALAAGRGIDCTYFWQYARLYPPQDAGTDDEP